MAQVRLEWIKLSTVGGEQIATVLANAEFITANTTNTVWSGVAPTANNTGLAARVTALDAPIVAAPVGNNTTTITEAQGVLIQPGDTVILKTQSGNYLAARQSTSNSAIQTVSIGSSGVGNSSIVTIAGTNSAAAMSNTNPAVTYLADSNGVMSFSNAGIVQIVDSNNVPISFTDPAQVRTYLANTSTLTESRINFVSNTGGVANVTLVSNTSNATIKVYRMRVHISNSSTITLYSNNTVLESWDLGTNGGFTLDLDSEAHYTCGVNEALSLVASTNTNIQGRLYFKRD